jgi:hypothetical protein
MEMKAAESMRELAASEPSLGHIACPARPLHHSAHHFCTDLELLWCPYVSAPLVCSTLLVWGQPRNGVPKKVSRMKRRHWPQRQRHPTPTPPNS